MKLGVVLLKDLYLRRNHYILTILELLLPLSFVFLFNLFMPDVEIQNPDLIRLGPTFSNKNCKVDYIYQQLSYSPGTPLAINFMKDVACFTGYKTSGVKARSLDVAHNRTNGIAVKFHNSFDGEGMAGVESLNYTIYPAQPVFASNDIWQSSLNFFSMFPEKRVLEVLYGVDMTFVQHKANKKLPSTVNMGVWGTKDTIISANGHGIITGLCVLTALSFLITVLIGRIVQEKNSGAKELMLIMGLQKYHIWISKFLDAFVVVTFVMIVTVILLFVPLKSNSFVFHRISMIDMWMILEAGAVATIMFTFFLSCIFKSSRKAVFVSLAIVLFSWIAYMSLNKALSRLTKILFCCLPHICTLHGLEILSDFEILNKNVKWMENLSGSDGYLTLCTVLVLLLSQIIVYGLLTYYVDAVRPGKYGVPQPLTFLFQKSYWCPNKVKCQPFDAKLEEHDFETVPLEMERGVSIRNLKKTYYSKFGYTSAVENINLDIYQGEITALLGHNGAGKTTTMSMITGMIPPSSGCILVNGYNTATHLSSVRQSMGVCPQQDMLFDDLTAAQTLKFYGMIKGLTPGQAEKEGRDLFFTMKMSQVANTLARDLSGGQKRKLSLAIAIIGGSKVLVLDEPTSGMDPEIRREIWEILLSFRNERTILITTHIMEEADVISDRIAIMDHGRVRCFGTPLYLKTKFGTGYKLSVVSNTDPSTVEGIVKNYVPSAKYICQNAATLTFQLRESESNNFENLFKVLDAMKENKEIVSYSLAITTLEDVFMRVREISKEEEHDEPDMGTPYRRLNSSEQLYDTRNWKGCVLYFYQFYALLIKKMVTFRKQIITFCVLSLLALVFFLLPYIVLNGSMSKSTSRHNTGTSRYTLGDYGNSLVLLSSDETNKNLTLALESLIREEGAVVKKVDDVGSEIQRMFQEDMYLIERVTVIAYILQGSTWTILTNPNGVHLKPIALNLFTTAQLRSVHGAGNISFVIDNSLLADEPEYNLVNQHYCENNLTSIPLVGMIQMFFYIYGPIQERLFGAKTLQLILTPPSVYWLSHLVFDVTSFAVFLFLLLFILAYAYEDSILPEYYGEICGALLVWAIGMLLLIYVISCLVRTEVGAVVLYIVLLLVYFVLSAVSQLNVLPKFFNYILPNTILHHGFSKFCERTDKSNNDYNYILYLAIYDLVLLAVLMIHDMKLLNFLFEYIYKRVVPITYNIKTKDMDVLEEERKVKKIIDNNGQNKEALVVCDLKKCFGLRPPKPAVKGVDFTVHRGECYGLLGVNGAGKSTTFRMLTAETCPTDGTAFISTSNVSSMSSRRKYLNQLGYCPQSIGLLPHFTGRQMLELFARLRGFKNRKVMDDVGIWLQKMDLMEYENKLCGKYSGGNQRKLNTAMALIGAPLVVFLDEPTSGVDPVARRNIWTVLNNMKKDGQSLILTSHSMDECEALCSRLAIMVSGQFMCLGETVTLKNKYGKGYSVQIMLGKHATEKDIKDIKSRMYSKFGSDCRLTDEHLTIFEYHISNQHTSWAQLFAGLEDLKRTFPVIETYTASETTLEQIFMHFARQNDDVSQTAALV